MIAWFVVLISFFMLAIQLFVTLIEFKLTTLAGFVLVPFGLFNKTTFLAQRVLGNVVASGVKVLTFAIIVAIGTTLFGEFTRGFGGEQPTLEDAMALVLAALSLLGLGIFGPGIANGLISGGPQLGAGAAVGAALAGAARGAGFIGSGAVSAYRTGVAASGATGARAAAEEQAASFALARPPLSGIIRPAQTPRQSHQAARLQRRRNGRSGSAVTRPSHTERPSPRIRCAPAIMAVVERPSHYRRTVDEAPIDPIAERRQVIYNAGRAGPVCRGG